jgi:hypothetical protein
MAPRTAWKKGQSGNPAGRKPGAKNRLPRDLIDRVIAISESLDQEKIGLETQARKDPKWFFENFMKPILPRNIEVNARMQLKLMSDEELNAQIFQTLEELKAKKRLKAS